MYVLWMVQFLHQFFSSVYHGHFSKQQLHRLLTENNAFWLHKGLITCSFNGFQKYEKTSMWRLHPYVLWGCFKINITAVELFNTTPDHNVVSWSHIFKVMGEEREHGTNTRLLLSSTSRAHHKYKYRIF